jgi:tetratricopeptide (TPR) repeat protein
MKGVENCENCGRAIGKLEEPYVWRKHVVCAECHVHLSSAPAAASAAARPAHAAPPLPLPPREHFHASPPVMPKRHDAPPAPIALQPEAPAAPAPSMFLCASCGQSFAFDDVVSDRGKVICRNCALAAAAQRARQSAQDKRQSHVKWGVAAAAAVVVVGGLAFGIYAFTRSRPSDAVAQKTAAGPRPPSAFALPDDTRPRAGAAAPNPYGTASAAPDPANGPKTLFPEATLAETPAPEPAPTAKAAPADPAPPPPVAQASTAQPPPAQSQSRQATSGPPDPAPPARQPTVAEILAAANRNPPADTTPGTGPGTVRNAAPAAQAPAPAPPPPEGTAAWHVYKGKELLAQNKSQPAMDQFAAAMNLDRNNPDAWHGAGLCLQNMGDRNAALERLEKANSLYNPPNRAAVFNVAVANLRDNPMRSAKLVKDYLAREDAAPDEKLHDLLGRAVFAVNRQGQKHLAYKEAEKFYYEYNEKLESGRTDGRRRWGEAWVPASEAAQKWNRFRSRRENVDRLRVEVDHATKRKEVAWGKLYDQRTGMRLYTNKEKKEVRERYEEAAKAEIAIRQQLQAAEKEYTSVEKPPLPQVVRPVPIDAVAANMTSAR